jgi:hypothetical protein
MGFDLSANARNAALGPYYGAGIEHMGLLRCAMLTAGVPETLVYKKFVSNDDLLAAPAATNSGPLSNRR